MLFTELNSGKYNGVEMCSTVVRIQSSHDVAETPLNAVMYLRPEPLGKRSLANLENIEKGESVQQWTMHRPLPGS